MSKEISFTATSIHCSPFGRDLVSITADADPAEVLRCFEIAELVEEFTSDSLLDQIGVDEVRKWLEANE
ncbi:hypothetical protein QN386_17830 [Pseudomonas sp. CCI3.2]|uniref:hypothetical protein n=1 Tax=unclassified Pseudomonas TaxID=196821 RepID=UPI002B23649E|nr:MULTISPECIES: hypothetical protein [unclassified Pseudomonas]MEB0078052.1 hypothetical protein [Pseudomonas sp. MH10out]MEB0103169.1 hypothetical protein [Pseudomonas sp. CCI3.2]MEB0133405.1 hypothetical protein [Pseudomonas sp. CCI2.4]